MSNDECDIVVCSGPSRMPPPGLQWLSGILTAAALASLVLAGGAWGTAKGLRWLADRLIERREGRRGGGDRIVAENPVYRNLAR